MFRSKDWLVMALETLNLAVHTSNLIPLVLNINLSTSQWWVCVWTASRPQPAF